MLGFSYVVIYLLKSDVKNRWWFLWEVGHGIKYLVVETPQPLLLEHSLPLLLEL